MSIRRRLTLSFLAILTLLGLNLMVYSWSDLQRQSSFEELRRAIARQLLISSVNQKLSDFQKQVALLSQMLAGASSGGASAAEITQFDLQLQSVGGEIDEIGKLADANGKPEVEAFRQAYSDLSASWRNFYSNVGRDQSRAITEQVMHSDPLSQQVIQKLLPQLQQHEKNRVENAGVLYDDITVATNRITIGIFLLTVVISAILAFRVSRYLTRGLGALKSGADAIGSARLNYRITTGYRDEIGELASAFNSMAERLLEAHTALIHANSELEAASRAKSQFLANMSHELRTPMNAIIGYSEMLTEEAQDTGIVEMIPDLQKINAAGKHLLSLINDILDLSKIEAGKVDLYLETFSISGAISDIAVTMQPLAEKNNNRLEIECAPDIGSMYADITKVRQILFNLLSNACKFTKGGSVQLRVERHSDGTREWIQFRVQDTGIGMTLEETLKVFDAFTQADASTTRKFGGTGLGLTISRRFCDLMGGTITVQSTPGQGTIFLVRLPALVADAAQPVRTEPASLIALNDKTRASEAFAGTVLVVDDDPVVHDLMKSFLGKEGFEVHVASSGEEGIRLAREIRPNVITLDVAMPSMDGWSILSSLKADAELHEIPVIMLTMIDDKSIGYALGASDYLTKPINREHVVAAIRRHFSGPSDKSVLIVEDDLDTREILKSTLEKDGRRVLTAENGRVALEVAGDSSIGLILLDLMMPEMDGFQFLEEFRRRFSAERVPIIVLTAKDLTVKDRLCLDQWVKRVVQKGGNSNSLLQEVRELVAQNVSQRAAARETVDVAS